MEYLGLLMHFLVKKPFSDFPANVFPSRSLFCIAAFQSDFIFLAELCGRRLAF